MSVLDRALSLAIPILPRPIVRHFSKPYIAGTSADDAFRVIRQLRGQGSMATLDVLGEFSSTVEEAEQNTLAYSNLLDRIAADGLTDTNVSVKLTALGLFVDQHRCLTHLRRLVAQAHELDNFVRIDMEDARCTTATLEMYRALREEFPSRVGVVLQSRLRRTLDDVDALTDRPANIRLCKGIYLEPRSIAYTDPEVIRRSFTLALERMIERGAYVGVATHDELLTWEATRLIRKYSLAREQYEFQMLLGVDEKLRQILLDAGHRLRVYVPYGEHWYSYSIRRLRENPQIAGHAFRALIRQA
jgi:proline dehydrogenase